jgi:hypothetical protein
VGSAGSATAPAAGSAAGSGAAGTTTSAKPAAAPAPTIVEASKDTLPAFGDIAKPKVNRIGPAPRMAKMPSLGTAKEAVDAVFDELTAGSVAKHVYEADGGYVVVQLVARAQPSVDAFDKDAEHQIDRMRDARGKAALKGWLKNRCETLTKAGKIRPAAELLRESDDQGKPLPQTYRPCMYFDSF